MCVLLFGQLCCLFINTCIFCCCCMVPYLKDLAKKGIESLNKPRKNPLQDWFGQRSGVGKVKRFRRTDIHRCQRTTWYLIFVLSQIDSENNHNDNRSHNDRKNDYENHKNNYSDNSNNDLKAYNRRNTRIRLRW
jgi:hypothetical protein